MYESVGERWTTEAGDTVNNVKIRTPEKFEQTLMLMLYTKIEGHQPAGFGEDC